MPEFRCRDADSVCRWQGKAGTEEELMRKVAEHARKVHKVQTLTDTLANFMKTAIRR